MPLTDLISCWQHEERSVWFMSAATLNTVCSFDQAKTETKRLALGAMYRNLGEQAEKTKRSAPWLSASRCLSLISVREGAATRNRGARGSTRRRARIPVPTPTIIASFQVHPRACGKSPPRRKLSCAARPRSRAAPCHRLGTRMKARGKEAIRRAHWQAEKERQNMLFHPVTRHGTLLVACLFWKAAKPPRVGGHLQIGGGTATGCCRCAIQGHVLYLNVVGLGTRLGQSRTLLACRSCCAGADIVSLIAPSQRRSPGFIGCSRLHSLRPNL